jgi:hypothetical protein
MDVRAASDASPVLCRGLTYVGLSGRADELAEVDVVDRSATATDAGTWLKDYSLRLAGAARFERAVMSRYVAAIEADSAFYRLCNEVFGLRVALEQRIQAGFEVLMRVTQSGVHSPSLDFWVSTAAEAVAAWDESVAGLFARWLLAGDAFDAFADALSATEPAGAERCECCGSPLLESSLADPVSEQVVRHVARCPLCGDRENWPRGGARIQVDQPSPSRPGERSVLSYRVTARDGPSGGPATGHLLVQAFDKANRTVFFDFHGAEQSGQVREVVVDVPPDVAGDLHYLWFVWVSGLEVSVLRRRWLCVRPALA